jgi:hypothetical protein
MIIQELEQRIPDLQKELADVQMEKAALRIQPCRIGGSPFFRAVYSTPSGHPIHGDAAS